MTFFSVKLDGRSVAIDCARISTAWLSSPCFLTKSSLAKMAAALPSDVGLKRQNLACLLSFCKNLHGSEHARALQLGEGVINHGRLHNLLESVVSLELCVQLRPFWTVQKAAAFSFAFCHLLRFGCSFFMQIWVSIVLILSHLHS